MRKYQSMDDMMTEDETVILQAAKVQMALENSDPIYQAALVARIKALEEMPDVLDEDEDEDEDED